MGEKEDLKKKKQQLKQKRKHFKKLSKAYGCNPSYFTKKDKTDKLIKRFFEKRQEELPKPTVAERVNVATYNTLSSAGQWVSWVSEKFGFTTSRPKCESCGGKGFKPETPVETQPVNQKDIDPIQPNAKRPAVHHQETPSGTDKGTQGSQVDPAATLAHEDQKQLAGKELSQPEEVGIPVNIPSGTGPSVAYQTAAAIGNGVVNTTCAVGSGVRAVGSRLCNGIANLWSWGSSPDASKNTIRKSAAEPGGPT